MASSKPFTGQAGIVTGASSGIGRVVCERLGAAGMELWLVGRSSEELAVTAEAIISAGGPPPHCEPMDLRRRGALAGLVSSVGEKHSYLSTLINCAGVMYMRPFLLEDPGHWAEMLDINLLTPLEACQAAVPVMRAHGRPAHLINVSSLAGRSDEPGGVYGASKAALEKVGRALRTELENDDIRITTIVPGPFRTKLTRNLSPETVDHVKEVMAANGITGFDDPRLIGDPEHIARAIQYVLEQPIDINIEEMVIRPPAWIHV